MFDCYDLHNNATVNSMSNLSPLLKMPVFLKMVFLLTLPFIKGQIQRSFLQHIDSEYGFLLLSVDVWTIVKS